MVGQSRLIIAVGVTVGITAGLTAFWFYRRRRIPTQWQRVGEVTDIMCYPIKSCAPIRESEMNCDEIGMSKGKFLRDRFFVVVDLDGNFLTAREHPKMVLIQPEIKDDMLVLIGPGMMNAEVCLEKLNKQAIQSATVWGQKICAVDCGEDAARWLSRYILSDDVGLRLMYYPLKHASNLRSKMTTLPNIHKFDSGVYVDMTSYMLMTENSVADLSVRTDRTLLPQQFRPNIVVNVNGAPYEEDNWDFIRIGKETVFRNVKQCTRCLLTTIDPETGIKDSSFEPLKTLRTYRQLPDPEMAKKEHYSPALGIHLGLRKAGKIKIGDSIYINVTGK